MFSLIWYFGLISFVVSAHSNNDTLHGGYKLNISTTMSTLPSTTIPVAKDCVLEMKESEISEMVELFNSARVHVVDIHVSFSNTSHDKELSDLHVKLLNPIGREILYSLERPQFQLVTWSTWTLNAGIRHFKLHVNRSQNDCIETQKNVTDLAFENMQNIVRSVNLATNYEVWYSFKEISSEKIRQFCCQITKHNLPKCNLGCSTGNSYLFASSAPWVVLSLTTYYFALHYLMWFLHVFLSRTEFDLEYPKYYKLEESRMSPSFIVFKIIFEENGRVVSFIRSLALIIVLVYSTDIFFRGKEISDVLMRPLFIFWGLSFSTSYLYRSKITNSSILLHKIKEERKKWSSFALIGFSLPFLLNWRSFLFKPSWRSLLVELLPFAPNKEILLGIGSGEFAGVIKVITWPFNRRFWRRTIKMLCNACVPISHADDIPVMRYALAVPICSLLVVILFLYYMMVVSGFPFFHTGHMLVMIHDFEYTLVDSRFLRVFGSFLSVCLLFFLCLTFYVMVLVIQSFMLGLFLNLIYFIPYFAFFSVLTFYCGNYWKTMEEKYVVLKRLIYEECRDIEHVNNGCIIPNRHPKREEKVLPVVSKELNDKIREKLLPYDTNLFYFALKILWAFGFSFGILKLIEMLNEFNVTGVVQVITTASLGVMPHIFNMIALKTSEERKKAREGKLKLNVKYMVEDLVREDPELARTVLIIQQNTNARVNGTTADENVQDSESVQVSEPDINSTDNDYAEGFELTELLMPQERNDTTADENVNESEKTEGLLKLLFRVCCCNDATTDENVQNSEHPCDDDDVEDPELTRLLQEFYGTTTDENVQDSEHSSDDDPELTRRLLEINHTTADDAKHPSDSDDGLEDPELILRLRRLREVHDITADEIDHDSGHFEAKSGLSPPDNDNVEDPELARTALIIEGIDTAADEIDQHSENVQGTSDLNPPDGDDTEKFPIVIVHAQKSREATADENVQDSEHTEASSDLNSPDNDMEEFPIVIVHAQENNDTTADQNVQDYELVEIKL